MKKAINRWLLLNNESYELVLNLCNYDANLIFLEGSAWGVFVDDHAFQHKVKGTVFKQRDGVLEKLKIKITEFEKVLDDMGLFEEQNKDECFEMVDEMFRSDLKMRKIIVEEFEEKVIRSNDDLDKFSIIWNISPCLDKILLEKISDCY